MNNVDKIVEIFPEEAIKVDYPDFATLVCKEVANKENYFGILVCGSGIGMSICANKINGIEWKLQADIHKDLYEKVLKKDIIKISANS